jgi:ligand-binding sensor domain-containing protein/two-component sensor histidine kinase
MLLSPAMVRGERLPLKAYTTANGLASNVVNKIVRDSRGFLWFCTNEGLARFDGYNFVTFGTADGLPHPTVNDILETPEGDYWVATNGGLSRFNPRGIAGTNLKSATAQMFTLVAMPNADRLAMAVTTLLTDRSGTLWCGTLRGLYRLQRDEGISLHPVEIGMPEGYPEQRYINALWEDHQGTIWIGAPSGLYRRWSDGSTARYGKSLGLPDEYILCVLEDRNGNLWVGTPNGGLMQFTFDATHQPPVVVHIYNETSGLTTNWIFTLYESKDGTLWAGTNKGVAEFAPNSGSPKRTHTYTEQNGLTFREVVCITEDRDGNLWLGTNMSGAMNLARNGFITMDASDWLRQVTSIFESDSGELYVFGAVMGYGRVTVFEGAKVDLLNPRSLSHMRRIGRFDGQRFTWLLPERLKPEYSWSDKPIVLNSRTGEWWVGVGSGLYRFPRVNSFAALQTAQPLSVYAQKEGLNPTDVYCLYEDRQNDLWVATVSAAIGNSLVRWERASGKLQDMSKTPGWPSLKETLPTSFAEDRAGALWVGFSSGALARYAAGHVTVFTSADGLQIGRINDLYLDRQGRLWIALMRGGVSRIDEPTAEVPTFTNFTTEQGLSSNLVTVITEDAYQRFYIGTGQGLDRLDLATGRIKHYTTADGIAPGTILTAFTARDGQLWFGTAQGLSRFRPEPPEGSGDPPPIWLTGLRVSGSVQSISANGETELHLPDFPASGNQLEISFVGLSFASGESLRYQYQLEGADRDWSPPTAQRAINYANLAPGHYRFRVRALTSEGVVSSQPASLTFNVLPHIWQRWWFLTLGALAVLMLAYAIYRYRVSRVLEVAGMRTRIATDLHDDIGANLTRISLLSEVAQRQFDTGRNAGNGKEDNVKDNSLVSISRIARESVSSMSDIVWSINPEHDSLLDLTRKMRQHADEVFTLRDINLHFKAPSANENLRVGVDIRRDLLLVFKEAVNNAARHSRCADVTINLQVTSSKLVLEIVDDGRGFDMSIESQGQGLRSMKRRAVALSGTLEIKSQPGAGTRVRFTVPLKPIRRPSVRR